MLHRNGPAEIETLQRAGPEERRSLGGGLFFLDERAGSDCGQGRAHDAPIAEDVIFVLLGGGVGYGVGIEGMHGAVGSDNAGVKGGTHFVPGLPGDGEVGPSVSTALSEDFVEEVLRVNGAAFGIEDKSVLVLENENVGAGRGSDLGSTLIQNGCIGRKMGRFGRIGIGRGRGGRQG